MSRPGVALLGVLLAFSALVTVVGSTNDDALRPPQVRAPNELHKVSVSTVALLTFLMAAATGLGAIPFFFFQLQPRWAGICNGIASGVMLAASFDLVQEGQKYGGGSWVVFGILSGGLFIMYSQKILEGFGDVKLMDVKGADARKMVLVIAIMTLHSFGEGSGVGVSFAGPKGLAQGITVTLAIAVHNIPEGLAVSMVLASRGVSARRAMLWSTFTSMPQPLVAVPAFICAEAFQKFLPYCMGFAAGCMIWMVLAEVVPDSFKDASPSEVASAATVSIAFMEILSALLENPESLPRLDTGLTLTWSLLFGLGPLLGGLVLVFFAGSTKLPHSFLSSIGSGIAIVLAFWRPLQLWLSGRMSTLLLCSLLSLGTGLYFLLNSLARSRRKQKVDVEALLAVSKHQVGVAAILAAGAMSFHAFSEGLALGVAASKTSYGLGTYMLLPAALHGLPRGATVASTIYGASGNLQLALVYATLTGFASPLGAILAILCGLSYAGLDCWLVVASGTLVPAFGRQIFMQASKMRSGGLLTGLLTGFGFACACLTSTRMVCLYTPYCNSAPDVTFYVPLQPGTYLHELARFLSPHHSCHIGDKRSAQLCAAWCLFQLL